jgi:hypothetical protein
MGDMRNAYRILIRKDEGKRPLGRWNCIFVFIVYLVTLCVA